VALALSFLAAPLLGDAHLLDRDLLVYTYPRLEQLGAAFAAGDLPRWNPWSGHGASFFGPRNGGVLYPPYLLFAALPSATALPLFLLLHYALATEGMRRLLRPSLGGLPAAAGGVAYGLGGYLASQYWLVFYLITHAALPWALHGGALLGGPRWRRGLALAATAVGVGLITCEPQGAAAIGGLAAVVAVRVARERGRPPWRALGLAVAAVALGAALAGPQTLSIADELSRSSRAGDGALDTEWGLATSALALDLLASGAAGEGARLDGGYWGYPLWDGELPWNGLFVGGLGLAAVCVAGFRRRRHAALGWTLVLLGLLLAGTAFGSGLRVRYPAKWIVLVAAGLAVLVGVGLARLDRDPDRRPRFALALAVLLGLQLVGALIFVAGGAALEEALHQLDPGQVDGRAARLASASAFARAALFSGSALTLTLAHLRGRLPWRRARVLLLGLLCLDLTTAAQRLLVTSRLPVFAPPPLAEQIKARPSQPAGAPARFAGVPLNDLSAYPLAASPDWKPLEVFHRRLHEQLYLNLPHRHAIRSIHAFESVRERAYAGLIEDERFRALPRPLQLALVDAELLTITRDELTQRGELSRRLLEPLAEAAPGVYLARNLACPPWAYVVPDARAVASQEAARDAVLDARRFPMDVAVLGPDRVGPDDLAHPDQGDPQGRVEVRPTAAESVELDVQVARPSWLIVREVFHPDWRVTLDGRTTGFRRADVLFRAVAVPAGRHTVRFLYDPWWWWPGLAASATALALLLGLCGVRPQTPRIE
jgi:hypothetical protein